MMAEVQNVSWPGWETVRLIGRGSFGAVYEIQRDVHGDIEKAALKVISIPQNASDIEEMYSDGHDEESITSTFQSYLKSISTEYSLMRKMIGSANIVNCDDFREVQHDDGIGWDIFIKMELLTPLLKALPAEIPEETVIKIAKDLCAALELCRKHNIVHRDIKPQNIFVSDNGDYKLGDFGVAKTMEKTMGGTKIGTYKYMAPEVYHNQPYGATADIYSLGLVLYWLLNERRMPFLPLPPEKLTAGMEEQARARRLSGEAIPATKNGSAELQRIVLKACAYDPKDRYATAGEMLRDLQSIPLAGAAMAFHPAAEEGDATVGVFSQGKVPGGLTVSMFHKGMPSSGEAARRREETQARLIREQQERERLLREQAARESQPQETEKKKRPVAVIVIAIAVIALLIAYFTVHIWTDADCVTSAECKICGKTKGSAAGHKWTAGSCTSPRSCVVCGEKDGNPLGHKWTEATCTIPGSCSRCGAAGGNASGHIWSSASCIEQITCIVCGKANGIGNTHAWNAASCTVATKCKLCGKEEGTALGHDWLDATYTAPKTCSRCLLTDGMSMGVLLSTCVVIDDSQSDSKTDIITGTHTSFSGKEYEKALRFWVSKEGNYTNVEHVVYKLGGAYDVLSCSIAVDEDSERGAAVRFYFYADGRLIYQSDYIGQYAQTQFEIDVSGVKELRVECETDEACDSFGILAATLHVK